MSGQRLVFVDRDGTLVEEPADFQVDDFGKLRFVAGAVPALLKLRDAGYQFVMVSNQDGLGTPSFPRERFEGPQALLLQFLAAQGIVFREVLVDASFEHEGRDTRKPGLGLLMHYLRDPAIDLAASAVVGDRDTDLQLADRLGCRGFRLAPGPDTWESIAHALADEPRVATVERNTAETRVRVRVDLDRAAEPVVATGLGFFDHMLEQLGKHAGIALELHCAGDLHIDEHHTVEDSALALGQALKLAIGDKRGIARYGDCAGSGAITLPMDESLAGAALDFSGRPHFVFEGRFPRPQVGDLPTELVPHFFRSLCESAGMNLHLGVRGENCHHLVEACFKAVARALGQAVRRQGNALPSTKGAL